MDPCGARFRFQTNGSRLGSSAAWRLAAQGRPRHPVDGKLRRLATGRCVIECQPLIQALTRLHGEIGESHPGTTQSICPCDIASRLQVGVRIRQIEADLKLAASFQWDDRLHGQALLAEIQNHAARDPIETGKNWPMHLMPQTTTSVCNHLPASTPQFSPPSTHEIVSSKETMRTGLDLCGESPAIVLFR